MYPGSGVVLVTTITDLQCGKAGEYLVCADLILAGYVAFPSEQGLSFDVVVEVGGQLAKVQVKTTRTVRSVPQRKTHHPGYLFYVKKMGKNGTKQYEPGAVDIFALVAIDSKEIGYLAATAIKRTMVFRSPFLRGNYADEGHSVRATKIRGLRDSGMTFRQIGKELGIDPSYTNRVCKGTSGGAREHRYLGDFSFSTAAKMAGFQL